MAAEALEGVIENGCVAAGLEAGAQFAEISRGLVANARQVGNGGELKWAFGIFHGKSFSSRVRNSPTSSESLRR
jgi:hypothetical protein